MTAGAAARLRAPFIRFAHSAVLIQNLTMPDGGHTLDPESSFDLLQRVQRGDAEALNRLLQRYMPALNRWARGRLPHWARDLSDTQDLVQDAVIQAMKHLGTFRPQREGALQAYLRQALMNRIRDELRRAHRRPPPTELPEGLATPSASPLEEAIGTEALDLYETALAELHEDEREAIIARVELGQSYQEVAAILGKPSAEAARVAVYRALIRLAQKMHPVV
jgi:RNA polymerase sigma-70 factor, ECF subfamily